MIAMWLLACTPEPQDNSAVEALEERVSELEREVKDLQKRSVERPPEMVEPPPPGAGMPGMETELKCEADGDDFVLIAGYEEARRNPFESMGRIQILPSRGGAEGIKILGVRKGSGAESCGFQNGDTVHGVNAEEFRGEEDVMAVLPSLVEDPPWDIEVTRRGELLTWQVRLP